MEDTTPRAFRFLEQWMYARRIWPPRLEEDWVFDSEKAKEEDNALVELWIVADKLDFTGLPAVVLDMLNQSTTRSSMIPIHCLEYVYDNTGTGSALRHHFVALIASITDGQSVLKCGELIPHEMLTELFACIVSKLPPNTFFTPEEVKECTTVK